MKKYLAFVILPFIAFTGCSRSSINLSDCKKAVIDIYNSGQYEAEFRKAIDEGEAGLDSTAGGKAAAVFDIDETVLSNYPYLRSVDFGYISDDWDKWIMEGKAEAIAPALEFYRRLSSKGIHIIFVTGRSARQYSATYRNLTDAGFTKFDTLIVRKDSGANLNASKTKEAERVRLTQAGYNIIASIGDQWSDMEGACTGRKIKLPNYIYIIK